MITEAILVKRPCVGIPVVRSSAYLLFILLALSPWATHAMVKLAWDGVDDDRVGLYQVWYGTSSGAYDTHVVSTTTTATINEVARNTNYYFVVRACTAEASHCSVYSNEIQYIDENTVPKASNDSATVAEDSTNTSIQVLSNDTDIDGDRLSVTKATASKGTVSVNANGTLRYSPPANYFGNATLNYTISDGHGGSDSASVAVKVTSVNDSPEATNDTARVAEGSFANTISVLGNDTDLDGDALSVTEASANYGSVRVNGNGTLSYSPQANLVGTDIITYVISDDNGGSDTASVTVTVTAVAMPIPTGLKFTLSN